jgi:hypothetical protein
MTWQAIIKGATGIQYFIRLGLSSFPKSAATWNECGRMALEVSSLTPWLLSDEASVKVNSDSKNIVLASRMHNGQLVIMAVNRVNEPAFVRFNIANGFSGNASLIFENREVRVNGGMINDYIAPFGTLVYRINLKHETDSIRSWTGNMVSDPGFEYVTSPGVPTSCYASGSYDRGATYFLDTREHAEGDNSLRLQTPVEGKSITIKLFPVTVKTGSSYLISVWAKCDPEQRFQPFDNPLTGNLKIPQFAELGLGTYGTSHFEPTTEWKQYVTRVTVPPDSVEKRKTNVILRMPGQGVGWFDMVQIIEDPLEKR